MDCVFLLLVDCGEFKCPRIRCNRDLDVDFGDWICGGGLLIYKQIEGVKWWYLRGDAVVEGLTRQAMRAAAAYVLFFAHLIQVRCSMWTI